MSWTLLTVASAPGTTGITIGALGSEAAADVADGNSFDNSAPTVLIVRNADAAEQSVTVHIAATVDGQAVEDKSYNLAAGEIKLIGPFDGRYYNQSDSRVYFEASDADVKVMPVRLYA